MMSPKEKYINFCSHTEDVPLFMQPYWLDAVSGSNKWDAVLSYDQKGDVVGAWAIYQKRVMGFNAIVMPYLTPFTGIYFKDDDQMPLQKRSLHRQKILEDLISKIPEVSYFEQKLQSSLQDWAPFYWAGFKEKTHYTFRFDDPNPDKIYGNFSANFKRNLRTAERKFEVEVSDNTNGIYTLLRNVFENQKQSIPYSETFLTNILDTLTNRTQCAIYRAVHSSEIKATIVTVWDNNTTYYLLSGRTFSQKGDATSLLLWQAIQDAITRGHHFDFEGSMMKGVHRFFLSFGATMTPYHYIYRYSGIAKLKEFK